MAGSDLIDAGDYSARRYAEFIDSLPAALFRSTIEGKMIYCNHACADLFGFDSALDLIDYPVIELYQNKKDRGAIIRTIMQSGRVVDLPVALKKKNGTPIWCALTAKAVLDDDGIVIHLDGILKEITAANEKFQGVLEMAGGVAHRLNQPLTIITNLVNEVLLELRKDSQIYGKIVNVHNQIKKMNDITDKLSRIKKYEAMDYVAGIKIVDLEKASWSRDKEEDR